MPRTKTGENMADENVKPEPMKPLSALVAVFIILAVVILWLIIGAQLFSIVSFFASFLFLWYWASVEHAVFAQWPQSLCGALLGLILAWLARELPVLLGSPGTFGALGLIALAIWFQLVGWLPLICNRSAMLFLTVLAAPALLSKLDLAETALAIALGAIYGAGIFKIVGLIASKRGVEAQSR